VPFTQSSSARFQCRVPEYEGPKSGKEFPFTDEIHTNRPPTQIALRKGWNTVQIRSCPSWKWCFTFTPVDWDGTIAREVPELRYSAEFPD